VTVTAQRRSEPLQDVPISVSVLTGDAARAGNVTDIAAVTQMLPGNQYAESSQFGPGVFRSFSIRGIRSEHERSVTSLYLDDTPLHMPSTALTDAYPVAFDLERIEILRGPQGVLFGEASEAGAIRFIPRAAATQGSEIDSRVVMSTTDGGAGSAEASAVVAGAPVPGVFGLRLGGWMSSAGGYVDRVNPINGAIVEANANRIDRQALRLSGALEPADGVRILPVLYYQTAHAHDAGVLFDDLSSPGIGRLQNGRLLRQPSDDTFSIASMRGEFTGSAASLTVIAAYLERHAASREDITSEVGALTGGFGDPRGPAFPTSYADAVSNPQFLHQSRVTGEVRVASTGGSRLNWTAGVFSSHLHETFDTYIYGTAIPTEPALLTLDGLNRTEESIFGNLSYRVLPKWTVGGGMRFGRTSDRSTELNGGYLDPNEIRLEVPPVTRGTPPVGRLEVTYAPRPGVLAYASASKGARGGGGGSAVPTVCHGSVTPTAYTSDSLWSYELGIKSRSADERLNVRAALYDIEWSDAHTSVADTCGNRYVLNVSGIVSRGAELDAEALLGESSHVELSVAFNDQHLRHDVYGSEGLLLAHAGDVVGGLPTVPSPWSATLIGTQEYGAGAGRRAFIRGELVARSRNPGPFTQGSPSSPFYNPTVTSDPAVAILNLRSGLEWRSLRLTLFVENALNRRPFLQRNNDYPGSTLVYGFTERPRTIALAVDAKY
jgi:outer membrane receptor protein involved in Fe transport